LRSRIVIQLTPRRSGLCLIRYSLHQIDKYHVVATTIAADRDEALGWSAKSCV
jgi:hypothetical protein